MAWAPDYCTATELKSFVRIADAADDAQVALAIAAASRAVDRECNRQFGLVASAEARYYTPQWDRDLRRWTIAIDDLMTETGLLINADSADTGVYGDAINDYALRPVNAAPVGRPWTKIVVHPMSSVTPCGREASVEVTGRWGWTAVPDPIKQATLLQSSRILSRRDAPFGIAGSPEAGSEMRLLAAVDPDVAVAVRPFKRVWGAA